MNASSRVVLDACVLANFGLCDLFLTLAKPPRLYQPVWNREILDEVQRSQVGKLGWPEGLAKSWRSRPADPMRGTLADVESCWPQRQSRQGRQKIAHHFSVSFRTTVALKSPANRVVSGWFSRRLT
jgi:hypothetical protein